MSAESIRVLIAAGFFMLLLLLRLEAERFGAAEYDEPGRRRSFWTRLSWYLIGAVLLTALYFVHPSPHDVLLLLIGHRREAVAAGLALAALGVVQAAAFARFWYGHMRLPPARSYPNAALNAIGTAAIDEATFRGALLGSLVAIGVPDGVAIVMATIVYLLATRLAAPGRHPYMPLLGAGIGLFCGWATLATGGLGAAVIGHAATSFAVFAFTGHPGQVPIAGNEPEEMALRREVPAGWHDVRRPAAAGGGAEPRGFEARGPSGYGDRSVPTTARDGAAARAAGALATWVRPKARAAGRATGRAAVALATWVRSMGSGVARRTSGPHDR
jgi:hypothetical protein